MKGLLMCAKYAFPPNLLQYCGPGDSKALFEILKDKTSGNELRNLLSQFGGAVPYLELIACSNGIKDIFDGRVVEAYWLGNSLLKNVDVRNFYSHLQKRFNGIMNRKEWHWVFSKSIPFGKPTHIFHVLDIYRRTGFLRSGVVVDLLETIDNCRICWGRVVEIPTLFENRVGTRRETSAGVASVEYAPLEFAGKKIILGAGKVKKSFLLDPSIKKGDEVSLHWNDICDKITPVQKQNLIYWTRYHLDITNETI